MHTLTNFTWTPSDEERYDYALEVLPPAAMRSGMFLLGEPMDHLDTGEAAFTVYGRVRLGDSYRYFAGSRPITRREFVLAAPPASSDVETSA